MPTYGQLTDVRNPDYDSEYWEKIRVLYEGGKTLKDTLKRPGPLRDSIFSQHLGEESVVFQERCKRAVYVPYMSQLVDYVIATLFSDPLKITAGGATEDTAPGSVDPYYEDFLQNVSKPGAPKASLNMYLRELALDAFLYKRAWTLLDFPLAPDQKPNSLYEEEQMGMDHAYCVRIDPVCVIDWEYNEYDGDLDWAMVHSIRIPRNSVAEKREIVEESFTVYNREGWERYSWRYKENTPPKKKSEPDFVDSGNHPFKCVPLRPLEIPDGLWAGGKLENITVELFNKHSALSWSQFRSLFQVMVYNLQTPDPMNPISEDGNRALNQPVGPGRVVQLAEKDNMRFIGPEVGPFTETREYIKDMRNEMHRVLTQMSLSVDNSKVALQRSAQSKQVDLAASVVICQELGRILREYSEQILDVISTARQEPKEWEASGFSEYDALSLNSMINEAAVLENLAIPSATWHALYKYELATRVLPGATEDQKELIFEELEAGFALMDLVNEPNNSNAKPGDTSSATDPNKPADSKASSNNGPGDLKTVADSLVAFRMAGVNVDAEGILDRHKVPRKGSK